MVTEDMDPHPIVDEFHPKASRTLFVGNLINSTTHTDLKRIFITFGRIITIKIQRNIKNTVNGRTMEAYAFIEYPDISSVVRAICSSDSILVNGARVNLGFRKSQATQFVWIEGVPGTISEHSLASAFFRFGRVTRCIINRGKEQALIFFRQIPHAKLAVTQMHGSTLNGRKIQADFASNKYKRIFNMV